MIRQKTWPPGSGGGGGGGGGGGLIFHIYLHRKL